MIEKKIAQFIDDKFAGMDGFQQIPFPEIPVQFFECAHDRAENIACLFRQICANSAYKSRGTGIRARITHQGTVETADKFAA